LARARRPGDIVLGDAMGEVYAEGKKRGWGKDCLDRVLLYRVAIFP
jgi:hypothetical protein